MRTKQFTRDVIDTLGNRIEEVVLPIPKSPELRKAISDAVREVVESRVWARDTITNLASAIAPD
jgi:type I restriction enzyme M protein